MIDVGEFTPASAIGPSRTAQGTTLGRETTTDEQRIEVIEHLTEVVSSGRGHEARATVIWSRGEPTILEVQFRIEHIDGRKVYLPDRVIEMTLDGGEIRPSEEVRLRTLRSELADFHDKGMT